MIKKNNKRKKGKKKGKKKEKIVCFSFWTGFKRISNEFQMNYGRITKAPIQNLRLDSIPYKLLLSFYLSYF